MPTYRDYFAEIKKRVKEATPQQVADLLRSGDVQLADVREKNEWDEGHLPGAVHVPKSYLEQWAEDRIPDKDKTTVLYCAGGVRSAMAADTLAKLGYSHVVSMSGGFNRWKDSGLPWKKPDAGLTPEQAQRYSRHLLIPEVGESGQQQLLRSKVLLIGAGGLGSPAALYLAAAGVGTLGIIDADVVDETNLQRQIVHSTASLGEPKVESATRTIRELNPDVEVKAYREQLTSENIERILGDGRLVTLTGPDVLAADVDVRVVELLAQPGEARGEVVEQVAHGLAHGEHLALATCLVAQRRWNPDHAHARTGLQNWT